MKTSFYPLAFCNNACKNALVVKPFKPLLLFAFLFLINGIIAAQVTAVQSGDWNDPTTWNTGVPASTDDVVIAGGYTVTVTSSGEQCHSLQIGKGLLLNSGALEFAGVSSLTVSNSITMGDMLGAIGTITMDNNAILTCGSIGEGLANITGNYNTNAGTIRFTGSANVLPDNLSQFYNLVIEAGTSTLGNADLQIENDLTVSDGAVLDIANSSADRNTSGGTFTLAGTASLKIGGTKSLPQNFSTHVISVSSTVTYYGSNQVVRTLNSSQHYGTLVINGTGTKTLNGNILMDGDLTITASALNLNGYSADRASAGGTLTVANAATLRINGAATLPANFTAHVLGLSSTVEYRGSSPQNIAPLSAGEKYGNLLVQNNIKTLAGDITVLGTLTFGGTPNRLALNGYALTLDGAISGSLAASRNFTGSSGSSLVLTGANTRTIYLDNTTPGTTNLLSAFTLNTGAAYSTVMGSDITVAGTLTFSSGKLSMGGKTLTIGGTVVNTITDALQGSTTSNLIVNSSANTTIYLDQSADGSTNALNNFIVNCTGKTVTLGSNVKPNGDLSVSAGTLDLYSWYCNRAAVGGTLTISDGAALIIGSTHTIPSNYSTHVIGSNSTVEYNGSGTQTVATFNSSQQYGNLKLSGSGFKAMSGNFTVRGNLELNGGILMIGTCTLTLSGSVTNTVSGGILGGTNSKLIVDATDNDVSLSFNQSSPGSGNVLQQLSFDCGSRSLTLTNPILITRTVFPLSGTMYSNGNLTLISRATYTASVSSGSNDGGYILGDVVSERYISAGRKWHLISVATNGSQTIKQAWQEGQSSGSSSSTGYGMWITSNDPAAISLGFDYVTPGNSMKVYDASSNSWVGITGTNIPIGTNDAYMIFVRGDRGCTSGNSTVSSTILRTTGPLNQGDQPIVHVAANQFGTAANTYPSAIDFRFLNLSGGLDNLFYVWDPKLSGANGLGGYQTFTSSGSNYVVTPGGGSYGAAGSVCNTIQSGQGFLLHATGSSGSTQLVESAKDNGSAMVSRPGNNIRKYINMQLLSAPGTDNVVDGVMIELNDLYSDAVNNADALKLNNLGETMAILKAGKLLSVEKRAVIEGPDTIFLYTAGLKNLTYRLKIEGANLVDYPANAFLEDTYSHTSTRINLNGQNSYVFSAGSETASKAIDRFRIILKKLTPVRINNFSGTLKGKEVQLSWQINNTNDISSYTVYKSANNQRFTVLTDMCKQDTKNCQVTDNSPQAGDNYYKVVYKLKNGNPVSSEVITIKGENALPGVGLYPNPVKNYEVHLSVNALSEGSYLVKIFDLTGAEIWRKNIKSNGCAAVYTFTLPENTAAGVYQLQVATVTGVVKTVQRMVIE